MGYSGDTEIVCADSVGFQERVAPHSPPPWYGRKCFYGTTALTAGLERARSGVGRIFCGA